MDSKVDVNISHYALSAFMQHYGYRSFFIDVTEDPWIALWFALNKFTKRTIPIFVEDHKLRSAKLTWAHYQKVSSGFVYVLGIKKNMIMQRYIPLTKILPDCATRVFRQKAGAISCDSKSRNADDLFLLKMVVSDPDKELINKIGKYTMNFLFPLPREDTVYRYLCTLPFFIPISREVGDTSIQLAEPILPIPFFATSIRELVKNFKPLIKILSGERVAFEWNVTNATTIVDGNQYSADRATRIIVEGLLAESLKKVCTDTRAISFDMWPSNNFIIEFDPDVSLIEPSERPIDSLLRGLWVVKGHNTFCISRIVDVLDDVIAERGDIYNLASEYGILDNTSINKNRRALQILLVLTKALEIGKLRLEKERLGYWRLNYKNEQARKTKSPTKT